ncbi:hypothetical protein D3C72_2060780 [compost metagenome]
MAIAPIASAKRSRSAPVSTFGSRIASAPQAAAARRSASNSAVPRALTRITVSCAANGCAAKALARLSLAWPFMAGATASSRSNTMTSQGRLRAFSMARVLVAGTYSTERRGAVLFMVMRYSVAGGDVDVKS